MKLKKRPWILTMIVFVTILSSCSTNRKSRIHKQTIKDTLHIEQTDSCKISYLLQNRLIHQVQWKHITLSPPDSTGKQYPQSITIATTDTQEETVQQNSMESTITTTLQEVTEETHMQEKQTKGRYSLILMLVLVIGSVFVVWRVKRQNLSQK